MIGQLPRNALIGLVVLLWALLVAAWLIPPVLDWNRYRGEIAALVSDELGESLTLTGDVRLVLLPQPLLVADDVTLSDLQDGVSLSAHELRMRVAFWPLLAGRVDAQEVVLRGLNLRAIWPIGTLAGQLHVPSWLQAIAARVEGGEVQIGGAALHQLNAAISLLPDGGGLALDGTTVVGNLPFHLDMHLTTPGSDGAAGVNLALEGQDQAKGIAASFTGQLAASGAMRGKLALRGPDLSKIASAPAVSFRLETPLEFTGTDITARDLALDLGPNTAHGAANYHNAHLDVALTSNRLDLDTWLPVLLHASPAGWKTSTSLDLSVEAASLAGANLRQLRGGVDLGADQITLRETSATLPGEAHLQIAGRLRPATGNSDLRFDGNIALNAPDLRTTLAWPPTAWQIDLSSLPDAMLRRADLRAGLAIDGGTAPVVSLPEFNGIIDGTHAQGSVTVRPGPRLGVAAKLDLDRLQIGSLPALGLVGLPGRFGKLDFDVQLRVGNLGYAGRNFAPVSLDAALEPGKFTLRRFEAELPGARLALAGSVAADGKLSDFRLDLSVLPDAETDLLPLLPSRIAAHVPIERLSLSVQGGGIPAAIALRGVADFGDLHAEAQPVLNLADGSWHGTLGLRHPGATRLITTMGFSDQVAWLGSGSFSLSGAMSGVGLSWPPQSLSTDGLDLAAGQLRALVTGNLTLGEVPSVTGRIDAESLPLVLPPLRDKQQLPFDALTGWQAKMDLSAQQVLLALDPALLQLRTKLSLQDGTLTAETISAKLEDGAITGRLVVNAGAMPPSVQTDLALAGAHPDAPLFGLPIDLSGGVLDGSLSLQASGYAPQTLLSTLAGKLHVAQRDGSLIGVDMARMGARLEDIDLRAALADGSTAINQAEINATLQDGSLQFAPRPAVNAASGPSGTAEISGLIDLVERTEELRLSLTPSVTAPPSFGLRVGGTLDAPTRTLDITEAASWRAEHLPPPLPPLPTAPVQKPGAAAGKPVKPAPSKPSAATTVPGPN